jgi:hypothetical protein
MSWRMRGTKGKNNMTWGKWQLREECWEEHLAGGDRWERGKGKEVSQDGAEWKTHGEKVDGGGNRRCDKGGGAL